jgi:hypothetical protein
MTDLLAAESGRINPEDRLRVYSDPATPGLGRMLDRLWPAHRARQLADAAYACGDPGVATGHAETASAAYIRLGYPAMAARMKYEAALYRDLAAGERVRVVEPACVIPSP